MAKFKTYKLDVEQLYTEPTEEDPLGFRDGVKIRILLFGIIPVASIEIDQWDLEKLNCRN